MSDSVVETKTCPACQGEMIQHSGREFCPACLLQQGMQSSTLGENRTAWTPPSIEHLAPRFPNLEIIQLLGQGGMGAVYKVRQLELERIAALKVLPEQVAQEPGFPERFLREARLLASLSHPHIVTVYEFGQRDGTYFLLMEFVDGVTLRQALRSEPIHRLSPKEALTVVGQLCDALQFAHDENVIHRDIKPENILIDKRGRVKIADFGLARMLGRSAGMLTLTGTNQLLGTPIYMAPEQIEGTGSVDHRVDIYSMGVVFYELLTGELPLGRFAPPSQRAELDARLDEVVFRTLEKEPDLRYQKASEVRTAVDSIGTAAHAQSRRPVEITTTRNLLRLLTAFAAGIAFMVFLPATLNWVDSLQASYGDDTADTALADTSTSANVMYDRRVGDEAVASATTSFGAGDGQDMSMMGIGSSGDMMGSDAGFSNEEPDSMSGEFPSEFDTTAVAEEPMSGAEEGLSEFDDVAGLGSDFEGGTVAAMDTGFGPDAAAAEFGGSDGLQSSGSVESELSEAMEGGQGFSELPAAALTIESQTVTLDHARLSMPHDDLAAVDPILTEIHERYMRLEALHSLVVYHDGVITTEIRPFPKETSALINEMWTQLDDVVSVTHQRELRDLLPLTSDINAISEKGMGGGYAGGGMGLGGGGDMAGSSGLGGGMSGLGGGMGGGMESDSGDSANRPLPGFLGWDHSSQRRTIRIGREGKWYTWSVSIPGTGAWSDKAPELPAHLLRFDRPSDPSLTISNLRSLTYGAFEASNGETQWCRTQLPSLFTHQGRIAAALMITTDESVERNFPWMQSESDLLRPRPAPYSDWLTELSAALEHLTRESASLESEADRRKQRDEVLAPIAAALSDAQSQELLTVCCAGVSKRPSIFAAVESGNVIWDSNSDSARAWLAPGTSGQMELSLRRMPDGWKIDSMAIAPDGKIPQIAYPGSDARSDDAAP
jgi:serine/threonine protein kinase